MPDQPNVFDTLDDSDRQAAAANVYNTAPISPDHAASVQALAADQGLPPETVQRNLPAVQRMAAAARATTALQGAPATAQWMGTPANAAVSHDEPHQLSGMEKWIKWAFPGDENSPEYQRQQQGNWGDAALNWLAAATGGKPGDIQIALDRGLAGSLGSVVQGVGDLADSYVRLSDPVAANIPGYAPYSTLTVPLGQGLKARAAAIAPSKETLATKGAGLVSGFLPSAIAGFANPLLMAATFGAQGADQTTDAAKRAGTVGAPLSDVGTVLNAGFQTALGLLPLDGLVEKYAPSLTNPVLNFLFKAGLHGGAGAATGAAMSLGGNVLTKATADPEQPITEGTGESALTVGALSMLMHGLHAIPEMRDQALGNLQRLGQSATESQGFDQAMDLAAQSKTRARAPDQFQTLMQSIVGDKSVYAPANEVFDHLNSLPPADAEDMVNKLGIGDQLESASIHGGDVAIPMDAYLTHAAGTPFADALGPHIRTSIDGFSKLEQEAIANDYQSFVQAHGDHLGQTATDAAAAAGPADAVYSDWFSKMRENGATIDEATHSAALVAARYATRADRLNEGVPEFIDAGQRDSGTMRDTSQDVPLTEQNGNEAGPSEKPAPEQVSNPARTDALKEYQRAAVGGGLDIKQEFAGGLSPSRRDTTDVAIDALRERRATKTGAGPSLLARISKLGGMADPGGELAAMDAEKWHVGKPFTGALIKDGGRTVGDMAEKLGEEGFLPVGEDGRASNASLLSAMRSEMAGKPIHADPGHAMAGELKARVDDLETELGRLGIDPAKATNEEIKAALAEAHGPVLEQGPPPELIRLTEQARALRDERNKAPNAAAWVAAHEKLIPIAEKLNKLTGNPLGLDSEEVAKSYGGATTEFAPDAALIAEAVKEFGTTRDPRAAGYILPDGRMLDLSEEGGDGSRTADHRSVGALDGVAGSGLDAMTEFMNRTGAARVDFQSGMFEAQRVPTTRAITQAIRASKEAGVSLLLEASRPDGSSRASVEMERPTVDRVQRFFEDEAQGRTFFQEARGEIALSPTGPALIRLFENRDLSTPLHELGHAFLEELRADAERSDAPDGLKADWEQTKTDLHITDLPPGGAIPTDAHETWARSFEAYLRDGKAPSAGLRGAFDRFKAWLVSIYREVNNLRVNVSPEMKAVFDRLLASDDEINAANRAMGDGFRPDAKALGMTDEVYAGYAKLADQSTADAKDAILAKMMRQVRAERTKAWNDEAAGIRDEVAATIDANPDVRALHYLTRGELLGAEEQPGKVRLNADAVKDIYGLIPSDLPRSVPSIVTAEGGAHPDDVAALTGHSSGEAMLNGVRTLEAVRRARIEADPKDKRSQRTAMIDNAVKAVMDERHGNMLTDGSIHEEALAAIHNEAKGRVLAAELNALQRKGGETPTPLQMLSRWAKDHIAGSLYKDVKPGLYLKAEKAAAGAFEKAIIAGDGEAAKLAKQRQLTNNLLYREAVKAREAADKAVAQMKKLADRKTLKSMDQDYLDRIHDLLERFDLGSHTEKDVRRKEAFVKWLNDRLDNDLEAIAISPKFVDEAFRQHYTRLTMDDIGGLKTAVDSLSHLGRLKQKLLDNKEERDFEDIRHEVRQKVADAKINDRTAALLAEEGRGLHSIHASLLSPGTIMRIMDNGDPFGPFNRVLGWGASDGNAAEHALKRRTYDMIDEAYQSAGKDQRRRWEAQADNQELVDPLTGQLYKGLTRANVFALFMHYGTESNLDVLQRGWNISEHDLNALIGRTLHEEDYRLAEKLWAAAESLWPEASAAARKLQGFTPEKIEGREVPMPFGTLKGGYWPLDYDPLRNPHIANAKAATTVEEFARQFNGSASTRSGHEQERTGYAGPLSLSVDKTIYNHINDVTKRIAWGEWVMSATKFLRDGTVQRAVIERLGREYHAELVKSVQRSVGYRTMDPRAVQWAENMMRGLRTNAVSNVTGINMRVFFEHASAVPQTIAIIGKASTLDGYRRYLSNPVGLGQFVLDRSGEMVARKEQTNRDLSDLADDLRQHKDPLADAVRSLPLVGKPVSAAVRGFHGLAPVKAYREFGHVPVAWANLRVIAMPAWVGAYFKAMRENPDEEAAARYADWTVRTAHPSGAAKDLASAQDPNSEFLRALTSFMSYHNGQYNLMAGALSEASQAKAPRDFSRSLEAFLFVALVAPISGRLLSGQLPEDISNAASWGEFTLDSALRGLWAGVPLVRNVMDYALDKAEGKPADLSKTPVESAVERQAKAARDLQKIATGQQPSAKTIEHLVSAPGDWLGVGLVQPARALQTAHDLMTGDDQRTQPLQVAHDLAFGQPPKAN